MRTINDKEKLVYLFQKWGVKDSEYWAEQELSNDRDAIVTMFRFLHVLQEYLSQYEDRTFRLIDGEIEHNGFGMGPSLKEMLDKGVSKETLNRFCYWIERMAYDVALTRLANPSAIDDGLATWPKWELIEVINLDHDDVCEEIITGRTLSRMPELFPLHDPDPEGLQYLTYRKWLQTLLSENRPVLDNPRSMKQLMELFEGWEDEAEWLAEDELSPDGYAYLALYRLFYPMQLLLDLFLVKTEEWIVSEMDEPRSPLGPLLKEMLGKGIKPEEIGKLAWIQFYWGCSNVLNRHDHLYSDDYDELPDCFLREIRSDRKRKPGEERGLGELDGLFPLRRPEWFEDLSAGVFL